MSSPESKWRYIRDAACFIAAVVGLTIIFGGFSRCMTEHIKTDGELRRLRESK